MADEATEAPRGGRPTAPDEQPEALDRARVPAHVALLATDEGPGGRPAAGGGLLDLVEGALLVGLRWLTVQGSDGAAASPLAAEGAALLAAHGDQLASTGVAVRVAAPADPALGPHLGGQPAPGEPVLTLTLAVGGSGRAEIVAALEALRRGGAAPAEVTEDALRAGLTWPDLPDPDLVVITSGDRRVPDFFLWQVAYSEFVFSDEPWPAFSRTRLYEAVVEFQRRDRRFGGVPT
ncbi:MAG TPA: undecaprenyl diphosphate synthase family protein [Acidimicrobiales bacterium]|nr:undecaprenyl diphosphate synthase family protein [Acidimicrobiales bacterium]